MSEDGLVEDEHGFVLIERHRDVANGYFSTNVLTTGLENEDDPSANTYCIIGGLDSNDYLQSDGYYDLKLIYKYSNGTDDVLEWTQTSWITEATITGADLTKIEDVYAGTYNWAFNGLGEASNGHNYLDGSGSSHGWWHAVASSTAITVDGVTGITGHQRRMAYSSALWIRPGIVLVLVLQLRPSALAFAPIIHYDF